MKKQYIQPIVCLHTVQMNSQIMAASKFGINRESEETATSEEILTNKRNSDWNSDWNYEWDQE